MLQKAILNELSEHAVKLILKAFPENCLVQDENGMTPLHHACAGSNAPGFLNYVMALVDASAESLTIQDNRGGTPLQLLTSAACNLVEKKLFPLHRLAARSHKLCKKSLQLLADYFPESITLPDKYGIIPFQYACLNQASSVGVLMHFILMSPDIIYLFQKSNIKQKCNNEKTCKRRRLLQKRPR